MKKQYIIMAIVLFASLCAGAYFYNEYKTVQYEKTARLAVEGMLSSAQMSEAVVTLYHQVWRNAIYKEESYYNKGPYYLKDFNEALSVANDESKDALSIIKSKTYSTDSLLKRMINPPSKYERVNLKIMEMYGTYSEYSGMALSPQGSLTSFGDKTTELSTALITQYKEINIQLP